MGDVRVERSVVLDATVDDVWRAITDEAELSAWFGAEVSFDPRPGGAARFDEADGTVRHAAVEEVDDGHRLVWRWWTDEGTASRVALTVDRVDSGTRLTVVEAGAGPVLASARAAAWDRRLLALELRSLVLVGV